MKKATKTARSAAAKTAKTTKTAKTAKTVPFRDWEAQYVIKCLSNAAPISSNTIYAWLRGEKCSGCVSRWLTRLASELPDHHVTALMRVSGRKLDIAAAVETERCIVGVRGSDSFRNTRAPAAPAAELPADPAKPAELPADPSPRLWDKKREILDWDAQGARLYGSERCAICGEKASVGDPDDDDDAYEFWGQQYYLCSHHWTCSVETLERLLLEAGAVSSTPDDDFLAKMPRRRSPTGPEIRSAYKLASVLGKAPDPGYFESLSVHRFHTEFDIMRKKAHDKEGFQLDSSKRRHRE